MSWKQHLRDATAAVAGASAWVDTANEIEHQEKRAELEGFGASKRKPKPSPTIESGSAGIDLHERYAKWQAEWLDGDRDGDGNLKHRAVRVRRGQSVPVDMRSRKRSGVPQAFLTDVAWGEEKPQGWSGQEFSAGLPQNESQPLQKPYLMRGRGVKIGTAMELYRGDPTVAEGVGTILDYVRAGRAEFCVPDELQGVAPQYRAAAGISIEEMQRVCDELNAELAVNRNVTGDAQFSNMLFLSLLCGFSLYEFDFHLDAPVTRRTAFLEQRHPRSVDEWILDPRGRPVGFTQVTPSDGQRGGRKQAACVDIRRCIHAVNMRDGWNPEGFPMVRPAWYWHRFGMEWSDTSLMHRMKFGAGLPIFRTIDATMQGEQQTEAMRAAAANHYASVDSYMALPPGVDFDIRTIEADKGWEGVMKFIREQKRACLGMGVLGLGEAATGSYALADVRSQMLMRRLNGMVEGVEAGMGHFAARYCEAFHGHMPVAPTFRITGLLQRSFDEMMTARERVTLWERSTPDATIEERNDIRGEAGMPLVEDVEESAPEPAGDVEPRTMRAGHGVACGCGACTSRARAADESHKPTEAMAEEAARGLEWRKEHGRGGTEVGVARARDISNRRNLSFDTVKRMDSYFSRHEVDKQGEGWSPGEDGYPSAGRIAWALWGGDAGKSWAAAIIKRADVETRAARKERDPLTRGRFTVEARDGEFKCYRPLEPIETHVAFRRLANGMNDWRDRLVRALDGVAKEYRNEFVALLRPLLDSGDLEAIAELDVPGDWPKRYREAIEGVLADVAEWAQADMLEEIESQVGDDWQPDEQDSGPSFAEIVGASAIMIGAAVYDYWRSRLRAFANAEAQAGDRSQISQVSRATLPPTTAAGWATTAVNTTIGATREETASKQGPKIGMVQRSEVMDENTCDPCRDIDGERNRFGSARYEEIKGQYHLCDSMASGTNRCRGIDIYEFSTSG